MITASTVYETQTTMVPRTTYTQDVTTYQARTEAVTKIVKVPVTIYEDREVTENVTTWVPTTTRMAVAAPCPNIVSYTQVATPVYRRARRANRWFLGKWWMGRLERKSARIASRQMSRNVSYGGGGYIYQPRGMSLAGHLSQDHGISTAGMSYQRMLELHTSLH